MPVAAALPRPASPPPRNAPGAPAPGEFSIDVTPLLGDEGPDGAASPPASPRYRWTWGVPATPDAATLPSGPPPASEKATSAACAVPAAPDLLSCLRAGYDLPGFGPAPGEAAMTPAERRRFGAVSGVYGGVGMALGGTILLASLALPICVMETLREPCAPAPPGPGGDPEAFAARCWGDGPKVACPPGSHGLGWAQRWCTQQLSAWVAAGGAPAAFSATAETQSVYPSLLALPLPSMPAAAATCCALMRLGERRAARAVHRDRVRRGLERAEWLAGAIARGEGGLIAELLRVDAPTYLGAAPGRPSVLALAREHGSAAVCAAHRVQRARLAANLEVAAVPAAASAALGALLAAGEEPAGPRGEKVTGW